MNEIYAEDCNYWQTGKSSADSWIDKSIKQIQSVEGEVTGRAFIEDMQTGKAAYVLQFILDHEAYKITWPVLESKTGKAAAARIQAATMLFHDVKAKCMVSLVFGRRAAFLQYLLLENGKTASEANSATLLKAIPNLK